jgi:O-antigen ligase
MTQRAANKLLHKIVRTGLYLTLVTPLVVWPQSMAPYIGGKVLLFQVLVEILIICSVPALFTTKFPTVRVAPTSLAVAAFLAAGLLSALAGVDLKQSLWGFIDRQDGMILLLHFLSWMALCVWSFGGDRNPTLSIQRFMGFSFVVAMLAAVFVLRESYTSLPPGNPGLLGVLWPPIRPRGVFGNPVATGPYLLLHLFFGLYLGAVVFKSANRMFRFGFVLLVSAGELLLAAAISALQTRGVILGFCGALLCLGLIAVFSRSVLPALRFSAAVIVFVSSCGVAGLWISRNSNFVQSNPLLWRLTRMSYEQNASTRARVMAWRSGLLSFSDHPLSGWGPRNVYYGLNKYYDPGQVQFTAGFQDRTETWYDKSHNAYIDLLAEEGVLGLIALVLLALTVTRALWRMPDRFLSICLTGALVAYAVSNITAFDTYGSLLAVFLVLAVISIFEVPVELRLPLGKNRRLAQKRPRKQSSRVPAGRGWIHPALLVCVLFLMVLALYGTIEIAQADHNCFLARDIFLRDAAAGIAYYDDAFEHFSPYNAREKVLCAYLIVHAAVTGSPSSRSFNAGRLVVECAMDAARARPLDTDVFVRLNEIYNSMALHADKGFANQAEAFGRRALELSPLRQEAAFTLGRTYVIKGEPARAVELNAKIVGAYPEFSTGHWFLGLSHLANEDRDNAKREIRTALGMGYRFQTPKEADTVKELFGEAGYAELMKGR